MFIFSTWIACGWQSREIFTTLFSFHSLCIINCVNPLSWLSRVTTKVDVQRLCRRIILWTGEVSLSPSPFPSPSSPCILSHLSLPPVISLTFLFVSVAKCKYICKHVCIYELICVYVCNCMYMWVCMYVYICLCVWTQAPTQLYVHK